MGLDVNGISDIKALFTKTGDKTPAGGICYAHKEHDMCAAIYDHGRKARVFFARNPEFVGRELLPCFFNKQIEIYA